MMNNKLLMNIIYLNFFIVFLNVNIVIVKLLSKVLPIYLLIIKKMKKYIKSLWILSLVISNFYYFNKIIIEYFIFEIFLLIQIFILKIEVSYLSFHMFKVVKKAGEVKKENIIYRNYTATHIKGEKKGLLTDMKNHYRNINAYQDIKTGDLIIQDIAITSKFISKREKNSFIGGTNKKNDKAYLATTDAEIVVIKTNAQKKNFMEVFRKNNHERIPRQNLDYNKMELVFFENLIKKGYRVGKQLAKHNASNEEFMEALQNYSLETRIIEKSCMELIPLKNE